MPCLVNASFVSSFKSSEYLIGELGVRLLSVYSELGSRFSDNWALDFS